MDQRLSTRARGIGIHAGSTQVPGEVSPAERRRMARHLGRFMTARDTRFAIARISHSNRGQSIESIIAAAEAGDSPSAHLQLPEARLIPLLLELAGADLLRDQELRRLIVANCDSDQLEILHDYNSRVRGRRTRRSQIDAVVERRWQPGSSWPSHFVHTLRLPLVYAGWKAEGALPEVLEVEPCVELNELRDFQEDLRDQLLEILGGFDTDGNRAILTLPTGAGKTRTTVEALLAWLVRHDIERPKILWIAQSDELCEQAVQAFREVWFDRGHRGCTERKTLTIGRLWAGRNADLNECDVIVASIQKLHAAERGKGHELTPEDVVIMGEMAGVVVVDEAHRALAPTYGAVLSSLGINFRRKRNPTALIGLTATPRRTGPEETIRLHKRFNSRILHTTHLGADPLQTLRAQGILATVDFETLDYDADRIDLYNNVIHRKHYENFEDIHASVLERLGQEHRRNRRILERILQLNPGWPVLLFACSVQHAQAMTALLQHEGRSAGCVLGTTRPAMRRALIERFRRGELSVLCNYGVLTTGFDAPKVRAVVVGRPTASPILYEQMVGRGMRGPEFGGTEHCLVIDVDDNIQWRNEPVTVEYGSLEQEMRYAD